LAQLEAQERDRCANERQGQLMVEMVQAALRQVDLSPESRHLRSRLLWCGRREN
jgi:hypothetical protein